MPLEIQEWESGINYWNSTNWPQDLHADFYSNISITNARNVFTDDWWVGFLNELSSWRAIRPKSKEYISDRAKEQFNILSSIWKCNIEPLKNKDIMTITWQEISDFTELVHNIKDVQSPVFTSKFCHFLEPKIFPIVDNAAMGLPFKNYRDCFMAYQDEWRTTNEQIKSDLKQRLENKIGKPILQNYPIKNKIIEICLIGRKQGNGLNRGNI
jgi:hypothetical protein